MAHPTYYSDVASYIRNTPSFSSSPLYLLGTDKETFLTSGSSQSQQIKTPVAQYRYQCRGEKKVLWDHQTELADSLLESGKSSERWM